MRKIGSKGAIPEQIPVNFIILFAMFAMGAAILLLMIGRWVDITGIKYKFETQRNAMNLLQLLVSNSPVVKTDPANVPLKLVLDAEKLSEYQADAGIGTETPSPQRDTWEKCCDFLDFDYNFTVRNLVTGENRTIGNLIFNTLSDCYPQRVKSVADIPVVIDEDGRRDYGVAEIEMIRTPLSELSFWLSQAFVRASWDKYWEVYAGEEKYFVKIPLDPEIKCVGILPVDNNYMRVCVYLTDDRYACKMFVIDNDIVVNGRFQQDWNHKTTGDCFDVLITVERVGDPPQGHVKIFYPGDCSEE